MMIYHKQLVPHKQIRVDNCNLNRPNIHECKFEYSHLLEIDE